MEKKNFVWSETGKNDGQPGGVQPQVSWKVKTRERELKITCVENLPGTCIIACRGAKAQEGLRLRLIRVRLACRKGKDPREGM